MDELIFPQPSPAPLILPRRLSAVHSNLRHQKSRQQRLQQLGELGSDDFSLGGNEYTHTYYYPTSTFPNSSSTSSTTSPTSSGAQAGGSVNGPPAIFAFGGDRAKDGFITATTFAPPQRFIASGGPVGFVDSDGTYGPTLATIRGQTSRRHSVASGSPWTTIPPKHALHMPIMKVNPEIWRSESHQREIHRLLHEGREVEVMRRRNIKGVMDTSEEGDEEDNAEMSGVVMTMDLGGFQALEDREKERVREEVMKEWARTVEQQALGNQLQIQQQQQLAEDLLRRRSWPGFVQAQQQDQAWRLQSGQLSLDQQQQLLERYRQFQQQQQYQQQLRQQQQQQTPTQLPPPGMQHRSSLGQGPLDSGRWTSSSSSGGGGSGSGSTDVRRASFTDYRG
ncbi:hypothetical protein KI688_002236 [Linnemannia hyalina]|uniref:Uncharacterized protein n=1 Tax=Linnemannia hyalina TaxID=64524 RepID=A0A9P7XU26_9FUNG|nr:hypothetical protein KI688_002236 [Linnemannia hyalina]